MPSGRIRDPVDNARVFRLDLHLVLRTVRANVSRLDPVFAMAESSFFDGGSRLDDVDVQTLASVSEWRSVAHLLAEFPNVGRCRTEYARVDRGGS